jgi:hypothetical protein
MMTVNGRQEPALLGYSAGFSTSEVEAVFQRSCRMFRMCMPNERMFQISFDLMSRYSLSHGDSML